MVFHQTTSRLIAEAMDRDFPKPKKNWDPIERCYVDRIDAVADAMETFGPLPSGVWECDGPVRFRGGADSNTPRADRKADYISTYTGRFYMFDPQPEDFCVEDVAHGLANICRYTGHVLVRYSVAEHSWHLAQWLLPKAGVSAALIALLHDAPEALSGFGDVARPSKKRAPFIKETEDRIWRKAVAPKFDLPQDLPDIVHDADMRICADEMSQNMHEVDPTVGPPLGITLHCWQPEVAELYFLDLFKKLMAVRDAEKMGRAA